MGAGNDKGHGKTTFTSSPALVFCMRCGEMQGRHGRCKCPPVPRVELKIKLTGADDADGFKLEGRIRELYLDGIRKGFHLA